MGVRGHLLNGSGVVAVDCEAVLRDYVLFRMQTGGQQILDDLLLDERGGFVHQYFEWCQIREVLDIFVCAHRQARLRRLDIHIQSRNLHVENLNILLFLERCTDRCSI